MPFRRKRGSPPTQRRHCRGGRPKSKTAIYEALDAALQDIYDHIRVERGQGPARMPDDSILRRLLEELLPDVPKRSSSLRVQRGSCTPSSSHVHQPFHGAHQCASYQQQPHHTDASNNNQHNANVHCYSGAASLQEFSLCFVSLLKNPDVITSNVPYQKHTSAFTSFSPKQHALLSWYQVSH